MTSRAVPLKNLDPASPTVVPAERAFSSIPLGRADPRPLLALSFLLGFLTLSVEMLTLRAFATVSGTSTVTTSLIIAIVVLSLSLGYFLAGRVGRDREDRALAVGLLAGAAATFLAPAFFRLTQAAAGEFEFSSVYFVRLFFLTSVGGFFVGGLPGVAFGYCSPLLFSRLDSIYGDTRMTASRTFIAGGFGSLLGSLVSVPVLIPLLGVKYSFLALGALLLTATGVSAVIILRRERRAPHACVALIVALICGAVGSLSDRNPAGTIARFESTYQTIFVREYTSPELGYTRALNYDVSLGIQSIYDPEARNLRDVYYDDFLVFLNRALGPGGGTSRRRMKMLIMGSGGGTTGSYAAHFYGRKLEGLEIVNLDIDGKVHEIARDYFGAASPYTRFITADARTFVRTTREKFDVVVVDAFSKGLMIPAELLTAEFAAELSTVLNPGGVVSMNVGAVSPRSRILQTALGSMLSRFPYVYLSDTEPERRILNNYLVTASAEAINFRELAARAPDPRLTTEFGRVAQKTQRVRTADFVGSDDSASPELLIAMLFFEM